MDPLSITVSSIALLQVSGLVINACYQYRSLYKSAPEDTRRLINELNSLRTAIEALISLLEEEKSKELAYESTLNKLSKPDGPLMSCQVVLGELEKKLQPKDGWRERKRILLWPLKEADMRKAFTEIGNTKATIQLALDIDQRKVATITLETVTGLKRRVSVEELRAKREKIFRWLDASSTITSHEAARKKHLPMTGHWFLKGDKFKLWCTSPNSFLWIYGIPGCGKTILCSTIVEELFTISRTEDNTAFSYFYFDFNDSRKTKPDAPIRATIAQLFAQGTGSRPLEKLFAQSQEGVMEPLVADLMTVLAQIIPEFQTVYLVIDALDECTELDDMLNLLSEMSSWGFENLHVLTSSRWFSEIEDSMESTGTRFLCLNQTGMDEDISLYIKSQLQRDKKLVKWPRDIQEMIERTLIQGSGGMFTWVVCQLDMLRRCLTISDLKTQLKSLPRTLEDTYEQILLRIDVEYREKCRRILEFLAFAARPVTFAEAAEVLAFDIEEGLSYNADRKLRNPEDLMLLCSTLVTREPASTVIYGQAEDEKEDNVDDTSNNDIDWTESINQNDYNTDNLVNVVYKDNWTIRLAHLSVKDYLLSTRLKTGQLSYFALNTALSNTLITKLCITYFMQEEFGAGYCNSSTVQFRLQKWPLSHYAANFWAFHLKLAGNRIDDQIWNLLNLFFQTRKEERSGNYGAWIAALIPNASVEVQKTDPLYYAASFGVEALVGKIVDERKGRNIDGLGGRYGATPLNVATYRGQTECVRLLLEAGADSMGKNCFGESCLYFAVILRYEEIRNMLERYGAKWTTRDLEAQRKMGMKREELEALNAEMIYGHQRLSLHPLILWWPKIAAHRHSLCGMAAN